MGRKKTCASNSELSEYAALVAIKKVDKFVLFLFFLDPNQVARQLKMDPDFERIKYDGRCFACLRLEF